MSANANQNIRAVFPGGPPPQPNVTGARDQLADNNPDGVRTFVHDRVVDADPYATPPAAEDTLTGATSGDVYDGLGHPGQGQTSAELRHDGQTGRKKQELGQDQWGTKRAEDLKSLTDER
ncbi:hypothetical protein DFH11DRAFT_1876519 [Phellopilus nigrolimitatus]|nr:hypothetical protein DFH11DRAFT_1876519 [Phellopilus nigrolimitatus]